MLWTTDLTRSRQVRALGAVTRFSYQRQHDVLVSNFPIFHAQRLVLIMIAVFTQHSMPQRVCRCFAQPRIEMLFMPLQALTGFITNVGSLVVVQTSVRHALFSPPILPPSQPLSSFLSRVRLRARISWPTSWVPYGAVCSNRVAPIVLSSLHWSLNDFKRKSASSFCAV